MNSYEKVRVNGLLLDQIFCTNPANSETEGDVSKYCCVSKPQTEEKRR